MTLKAYVVLYASAAEASVAQAAEFMTALGGKANVALDNVIPAQSFKDMSIGWGMPDYSAGITGTLPFTAPKSGKISVNFSSLANNDTILYINGVSVGSVGNGNSESGISVIQQFDVSGGDVVTASGGYKDFPCKGVN